VFLGSCWSAGAPVVSIGPGSKKMVAEGVASPFGQKVTELYEYTVAILNGTVPLPVTPGASAPSIDEIILPGEQGTKYFTTDMPPYTGPISL